MTTLQAMGCGTEEHGSDCLCDVKLSGPEPEIRWVPELEGEAPMAEFCDWANRASLLLDRLEEVRAKRAELEATQAEGVVYIHPEMLENIDHRTAAVRLRGEGHSYKAIAEALAASTGRVFHLTAVRKWCVQANAQGPTKPECGLRYTLDQKAWAVARSYEIGCEPTKAEFAERYGVEIGARTLEKWRARARRNAA